MRYNAGADGIMACARGILSVRALQLFCNSFADEGMLQNRLVALCRFVLLRAAGLGNFVEGCALHTFRRSVNLI